MTRLLEQAVAKARGLSAAEQDELARLMMEEIEGERKWEEALSKSPEKLAKLADKAWAEHEAGKSETLDPDAL
jgi:hypothetical protein